MPSHVFGHGRLTHRDSQLQELSVNPKGTPQRIRRGQLPDQRAYVRWDARVPRSGDGSANWDTDLGAACSRKLRRSSRQTRFSAGTPSWWRGSGPTEASAERQPRHRCDSNAHSRRSASVNRRRGGGSDSRPPADAEARGSLRAALRVIEPRTEASRAARRQGNTTSRA